MNILFLSSEDQSTSTKLLARELKTKGCKISIIDPRKLALSLSPNRIFDAQSRPLKPDFVIPRFGLYTYPYGIQILRAFEAMGVPSWNNSRSIEVANDKLTTLSLLARNHYPIPRTWVFHPTQDFYESQDYTYPLILKIFSGSQGKGVTLIKDPFQLRAWSDLLRTHQVSFMLQEYVKGNDLRILVMGKRVLAAMERIPAKGEFRSNLHLGGKGKKITLKAHEESLALETAALCGLDFAGVDLIRGKKGPLILEINAFPGLEGISKTTRLPLAKEIALAIIDR